MAVITSGGPNGDPPLEECYETISSDINPENPENMTINDTINLVSKTEIIKSAPYCSIFDIIQRSATEPPAPMIWSGIKKGSFGYVYGPAKSGKTILCENLGMSIAAGKESFLGMQLNCTGINNVLFISMEENWKNRTERNSAQVKVLEGINYSNFNYFVVDEKFPYSLSDHNSWKTFTKTIAESKADLVIVDSLTRVTRDEIENSKTGSQVSAKLREITNNLGITMIVIHHSSKISNSVIDIANMAGSRVIGQEADFILGVNKLPNNIRYFKEVANRYKQENELVTVFSIDDNLWIKKIRYTTEQNLLQPIDHRENAGSKDMVMDTIMDIATNLTEIKRTDIVKSLDGSLSKSRVYEILNNLEQDGLIKPLKKGVIKLTEEQD